MALSLGKARSSVKDHPVRLWNQDMLGKVVGVGRVTVKLVEKNLWALFPPEPPTEEEEAMQAALDAQEKAAKAQTKEKAALKRKATTASGTAGGDGASGSGAAAGGDPLAGGVAPAKKLKAADLPYVPKVGSGNYAILVALYIARHEGRQQLTKADLMQKAEALGIAHVSMFGAGQNNSYNAFRPNFSYDGWSSFSTMKNRTPPLVQAWSNPLQVRLTAEGVGLAARLYKNALATAQHLQPVAGLDPDADIAACAIDWEPIIAAKGTKALAAAVAASAAGGAPPPPAGAGSPPAGDVDAAAGGGRGRGRGGRGRGRGRGRGAAARELSPLGSDPHDPEPPPPAARPSAPPAAPGHGILGRTPIHLRPEYKAAMARQQLQEADRLSPSPSSSTGAAAAAAAAAAGPARPSSSMGAAPAPAPAGGGVGQGGGGATAGGEASSRAGMQTYEVEVLDLVSSDDDDPPPAPPAPRPPPPAAAPLPSSQAAAPPAPPRSAFASAPCASQPFSAGAGPSSRPPLPPSQALSGPLSQGGSQPGPSSSSGPRSRSGCFDQGRWKLPRLQDEVVLRAPPLAPGTCFRDVYEVVLVIDNREQYGHHGAKQAGLSRLQQLTPHIQRLEGRVISKLEGLQTGDVLWVARRKGEEEVGAAYVLDVLVERKRVDDLDSSIKDARYQQQKYWMKRSGVRRCMYLLEGDPETLGAPPMVQAAKTAMGATEVQDGFTVLRTQEVSGTFTLFCNMTDALKAAYEGMQAGGPNHAAGVADPLLTLSAWNERLRKAKESISVRDTWGLMLTSLSGLGDKAVEAVLASYPTPKSLWQAYLHVARQSASAGQDPDAACDKLLADLTSGPGTTLGPSAARQVYRSLFKEGLLEGAGG